MNQTLPHHSAPVSELDRQIGNLTAGAHLCLFYEDDPSEQLPALVPFIQQALEANEQFVYLADEHTIGNLKRHLEENDIDVPVKCARGNLQLLTQAEWRQHDGADSRSKALQVKEFIDHARAAGFSGIRFVAEMTWTLGSDIDPEQLEDWEGTLHTLFPPDFPTRMICQYARRQLSPATLLAALHTHPLVLVENQVRSNLFYHAPLLSGRNGNSRVHQPVRAEWMIRQLQQAHTQQREQTEHEAGERQKIEEALRVSEERFRLAAQAEALTLYEQDAALRYIWLYPQHTEHAGALGKTDLELLPEDQGRKLMELKRQVLSTGLAIRREVETDLPTGRHVYDLFISPRRNGAGEVIGVAGIAVDITEHRRAEDASQHLAAIVESSEDAIISKDLNGIITSWNRGAEKTFGYSAGEIIGRSVTQLMSPERKFEEQNILARIRRGESIQNYETVRQHKDGSLLNLSLTVSPIRDRHGRIIGASKSARDISLRKKIEQQQQALYDLASSVNRAIALPQIYHAALDAICRCHEVERAAILLFDSQKIMRFKAWRGLSDQYRQAVEGHSPWNAEDPDPKVIGIKNIAEADLEPTLRATVEAEGIRALAFIPITAERQLLGKFMIYYNRPHEFTPGDICPAQTIASQIAFALQRHRSGEALERLVAERTASLREAIAQMEEFSYSVSHDLRAPVRAIQGYAKAMLEDFGARLNGDGQHYLERIVSSSSRMDRLIQDILTYSRLTRRELKLTPIPLDHLVREILQQYPDLQSPRAEVIVRGTLLNVTGHEPSLSQAISNLLNNAVKFVRADTVPQVEIWTELRGADVRLWIQDNGIGIKPEYQHRLFGLFERVHPAENYEGTGIGLAIVRKSIERMGGQVGVVSDGAHGSRFWIQLPDAKT